MGLYLRSSLRPAPWPVPYTSIVLQWLDARLDPASCRAVIERAIQAGMPEGLLDPEQVTSGGVVGTERLLYDDRLQGSWRWTFRTGEGPRDLDVPMEYAPTLAELVRIAARADSRDEVISAAREYVDDDSFLKLMDLSLFDSREHGVWPRIELPGVYRREHASLLIRSNSGSTLVTDPKRCARDWTTNFDSYPSDRYWDPVSVLITHSHDDHFDLTSIVSYLPATGQVYVPHVPQPTLLSSDMAALLEHIEQPAVAARWWTEHRIGDISVNILPFYGEQPTRSIPMPFNLRNWGNCYRFELDGWSFAILADSGADPLGNVTDALAASVEDRGPIDILMSCCFTFQEMLNAGLAHYAFTVPFETIRAQYLRGFGAITSTPRGVAQACRAAKARYFMPYAHGFQSLYGDPGSPASHESINSESSAVELLRAELLRTGTPTTIIDWKPGQCLRWSNGEPKVHQWAVTD